MDSSYCPGSPLHDVSTLKRPIWMPAPVMSGSSPLAFRPVTPMAMEEILPYLEFDHGRTTDFSYGGILMWVDFFKYEYCIFSDTLFIKGLVEDNTSLPAFSLPLGRLPLAESVNMVRDYCRQHSILTEFSAVPAMYGDEMWKLGAKRVIPMPGWSDYLYDIHSMSSLKGKKMSKKRNHVNRFMSLYPEVLTEDVEPKNAVEALSFMDVYDCEADGAPMELVESALTRKMLNLIACGQTHFEGIILRVGDRIVGFSIGDVKRDTLYVHIEKATRSIPGSYEMVCNAFVKRMLEKYPDLKFVNREDDGGDEGLRRSKMSYHPIAILEKNNIIF